MSNQGETSFAPDSIAMTGCTGVYDVQFPDCSLDPQTKTAYGKVGKYLHGGTIGGNIVINVDEITFKVSRANSAEIELFPNKPSRVTVIEPNQSYSFQGQKDERIYKVTIDREFDRGLKKTIIVGTCDPQK